MKTLEDLKDAIAPLKRGKWVAGAVLNPGVESWRRAQGIIREAVERRANEAVDEAVAACFLAMGGATPAEPTALEALKYIDGWIDNKLAMNIVPAARWALEDEMRVHIRAAIERLENGGQLRATTPVGDFER